MLDQTLIQLQPSQRRSVRLDTLVRLRWVSVIGQTAAVLVVYFGFDYTLPIWGCLSTIALAAWLNVALRARFRQTQRVEPDRAAWLLAFDTVQLALLMFLTGGLANPFSFFFLGPVLLAATALPPRMTAMIGLLATVCASLLIFFHYPLPWNDAPPPVLPQPYMLGVWLSTNLAIFFISIYAWQLTEEARQLSDALTATELVLAREQHLSQLDGLAAAAAHELGTPLSTISVIAKELEREIEPGSPHAEDMRLLREQSQRCREILAKLTELSSGGEPYDRMPLVSLIEEVVSPHRNFGVTIDVAMPASAIPQPVSARNPAILYGLGNILENAVDYARGRVEIVAEWSEDDVAVAISDDGPGFSSDIMARIGEPYVRSNRRKRSGLGSETSGLGLGVFIAKTLLERSGARLAFENRTSPARGAVVRILWGRSDFERPILNTSMVRNGRLGSRT